MNPQLERQTNIFVVRIWREYLLGEHPALRGEVEDLAQHERHPFSDIQELERIVREGCQHIENKTTSDGIKTQE